MILCQLVAVIYFFNSHWTPHPSIPLTVVVYWPIPGRECVVDYALGRSEARTSVGTMR